MAAAPYASPEELLIRVSIIGVCMKAVLLQLSHKGEGEAYVSGSDCCLVIGTSRGELAILSCIPSSVTVPQLLQLCKGILAEFALHWEYCDRAGFLLEVPPWTHGSMGWSQIQTHPLLYIWTQPPSPFQPLVSGYGPSGRVSGAANGLVPESAAVYE